MKFIIIPALITGIVINIFVLYPETGIELRAEWLGSIKNIDTVDSLAKREYAKTMFTVAMPYRVVYLDGNGKMSTSFQITDFLVALSGSGEFYVKYEKLGSSVEFHNAKGDRFWKVKSSEYPYLSHNGKLVFLMSADQSRVRILDYNGNEVGRKTITGRFCTALSFSEQGDLGSVGFLDGSYYFVDERGALRYSGSVRSGHIVKGIAVSNNGKYGVVHHGDFNGDYLDIVAIEKRRTETGKLKHVHKTRIALYVSENGHATVLDTDSIVHLDDDADVLFSLKVKPARIGYSAISSMHDIYAATYTMSNGEATALIFNEQGDVMLSKEFPADAYVKPSMKGNLILLQGSDNLYCYSIHQPKGE